MNTMMKLAIVSGAAFLISFTAQAHEPEEHMKEAQSPDCAAMADMDHDKMDMDDPVMAAMMKQCMASGTHGEVAANAAADGEHGHADANTQNHAEHSHETVAPVTAAVAEDAHQH